jgi:hypothetical protein
MVIYLDDIVVTILIQFGMNRGTSSSSSHGDDAPALLKIGRKIFWQSSDHRYPTLGDNSRMERALNANSFLVAVAAFALAAACSPPVVEQVPVAAERTFYSDGACDSYTGDTCVHYVIHDAIRH